MREIRYDVLILEMVLDAGDYKLGRTHILYTQGRCRYFNDNFRFDKSIFYVFVNFRKQLQNTVNNLLTAVNYLLKSNLQYTAYYF